MLKQFSDPHRRNLFISGKSGVGKTVTVKRFLFELKAREPDVISFYVPIRKTMSETWRETFPDQPHRKRNEMAILDLTEKPVVVFDDVTSIWRRTDLDKTLYSLFEGTDGYLRLILVGVGNLYSFEKLFLSESVQSRLQLKPLTFEPYKIAGIMQIFEQRLGFAVEGEIHKEALQFIAEKVRRHGSDMRLGIRLLKNALNIAVERQSPFSDIAAEMAWEEEKLNYWEMQYTDLHPHQSFILYLFFKVKQTEKHVSSKRLYLEYYHQCKENKIDPMTTRQLSHYLEDLEQKGFINRDVDLKPRMGKVTKITSDLPTDLMVLAGERIDWGTHVK